MFVTTYLFIPIILNTLPYQFIFVMENFPQRKHTQTHETRHFAAHALFFKRSTNLTLIKILITYTPIYIKMIKNAIYIIKSSSIIYGQFFLMKKTRKYDCVLTFKILPRAGSHFFNV